MSNVIITLAHHLDPESAQRLGLPSQDLLPGTDVVVTADVAAGLIGAGYAAVDTEHPEKVAKALRRKAPADHPVGIYQEPEGSGEDDGKTAAEKVNPTSVEAGPDRTAPASKQRSGKS